MHFLKFQVFTVYIIGAIPVLAAKNGDDVYKFPTRRAEKYYWNMVDMCHVKHELELILKFGVSQPPVMIFSFQLPLRQLWLTWLTLTGKDLAVPPPRGVRRSPAATGLGGDGGRTEAVFATL
ncbi:hypothetical protein MGG_16137 [Pyricularia oryzae 70-15]|uniref:Uncharacterized protein n=3 Tax=Pyricularia oryzae TaxID=318829 RepID=G4MK99_PYRO7|nr:uncharacterized protein MGG_16137 [Pyricularia oryzae 70-15]EHA56690.1 hypothetical protein MGG_16137 [Pyricularia oryzae 70-15]ELQ35342.1 hypothetical protein OOU_Y34scaffold00712g15 [Pyricularia oryzae Y34]